MWPRAKLKFVARLGYGDMLPNDESQDGAFRVFGSNGPFASFSRANTGAPAIVIGRKGSYGKVNWTAEPCFASDTTFFVDESTSRNHLRWVYWLLQTLRLDEGTDETAVPGLNRETAYSRDVLVPPLPQQRAIADYLDRETARLDALVAAKERVLGLLAEKRQALITRAVTRGLGAIERPFLQAHPGPVATANQHGAEAGGGKDHAPSGVSGLQECIFPTRPLKHIVSLRRSRISESESARPYVGLENIESWTGRLVSAPEVRHGPGIHFLGNESSSNAFDPGDVLLGKLRPYLAKSWLAEFRGRCTNELLVMQPVAAEPRFLRYVCVWPEFVSALDASTYGSKMPRAEWNFIGRVPVPVPPLAQQRAIADYLDRETARLDTLSSMTEDTIALIKERRAALISAAVTGQTDVKEEACELRS